MVQLLLLKDVRGYTPLDYARSEDRGKWLRFFMGTEIDITYSNSNKRTTATNNR